MSNSFPATGIVAAIARTAMEEYTNVKTPPPPKLTAEATAASGVLADGDDVAGTASVGAMLAVHHKGFGACGSGDLVDARTSATHFTGSTQIPFMFTGLSFGGTVDREVRVPLATRAELFRAPVSRVAMQFSAAFIDMEMTEKDQRARILAMPFTVERVVTTQDDGVTLQRYTSTVDVAMFRIVGADAKGTGELTFGNFGIVTTSASADPEVPPLTGYISLSFLHLAGTQGRWSMDLDGGLALDGPEDCKGCQRGFYTLALGHHWDEVAVEGRDIADRVRRDQRRGRARGPRERSGSTAIDSTCVRKNGGGHGSASAPITTTTAAAARAAVGHAVSGRKPPPWADLPGRRRRTRDSVGEIGFELARARYRVAGSGAIARSMTRTNAVGRSARASRSRTPLAVGVRLAAARSIVVARTGNDSGDEVIQQHAEAVDVGAFGSPALRRRSPAPDTAACRPDPAAPRRVRRGRLRGRCRDPSGRCGRRLRA